jgi:peptide/nickel transport system substrate-binding protein
MRGNRKWVLGIVFCLTWLSVTIWPAGAQAQKVVVAQGIDAETLDVQITTTIPTLIVNYNIYDTLLGRDADLKFTNRLAVSHENIAPDKWRFHLRKGVTFHNGEPFDAASVKFSFERVFFPETKSNQKGWYSTIDRVEVVDDYTVDIITKKPDPVLPARMTLLGIVPPKMLKDPGAKIAMNPVGTGPFQFVKWVRDDQIVLKANEKYWDGAPAIKELIFRAMPETQSRLAALQTGEIDIATNIPPDLAEGLKGKGNFDFKSVLSTRVIHLQMHKDKDPLAKQKVRQAINYAIDKDSIIKNILSGYGEKIPSLVPKPVFGFDADLKPYPYDPQKAKQLLAEAGYPNGFDIVMNGPSGRYMRDKEVCQAIAGQLGQVGIRVNLKLPEWGTYASNIYSHKTDPLWFIGWSNPALDPDQFLWPTTHSNEPVSRTNDPELDKLLEQGRSEMNVEQRQKIYSQAIRHIHDQAFVAVLYEQKDLVGVSKRIDFTPRGDEMIFLKDVKVLK